MCTKNILAIGIVLILSHQSTAQEMRESIFGSASIQMAEERIIPDGELWILSSMDVESYVGMETSFGATVAIGRKEGATDPLIVTIAFIDKWPNDKAASGFSVKLPIVLYSGTKLTLGTSAGERILFYIQETER